jgi:hypothetical protein
MGLYSRYLKYCQNNQQRQNKIVKVQGDKRKGEPGSSPLFCTIAIHTEEDSGSKQNKIETTERTVWITL